MLQLLRSGCGGAWRRVAGRGAQPCGRKGVWLAAFEGAGVAGTLILRSISSTEKTCSQWRAVQWRNAVQKCGGGVCREEAPHGYQGYRLAAAARACSSVRRRVTRSCCCWRSSSAALIWS